MLHGHCLAGSVSLHGTIQGCDKSNRKITFMACRKARECCMGTAWQAVVSTFQQKSHLYGVQKRARVLHGHGVDGILRTGARLCRARGGHHVARQQVVLPTPPPAVSGFTCCLTPQQRGHISTYHAPAGDTRDSDKLAVRDRRRMRTFR